MNENDLIQRLHDSIETNSSFMQNDPAEIGFALQYVLYRAGGSIVMRNRMFNTLLPMFVQSEHFSTILPHLCSLPALFELQYPTRICAALLAHSPDDIPKPYLHLWYRYDQVYAPVDRYNHSVIKMLTHCNACFVATSTVAFLNNDVNDIPIVQLARTCVDHYMPVLEAIVTAFGGNRLRAYPTLCVLFNPGLVRWYVRDSRN